MLALNNTSQPLFLPIPSSYTLYQLVKKCKHLAVINNVLSKQRFLKVYAENKGEIAEADYLVFNFRNACGLTSLVSGTRLIYLRNFCQIPFQLAMNFGAHLVLTSTQIRKMHRYIFLQLCKLHIINLRLLELEQINFYMQHKIFSTLAKNKKALSCSIFGLHKQS